MAGLYLLNLEGCPAADSLGKSGQLWVRLLWDDRRVRWHEEADSQRIRDAFRGMASTCTRWPAPSRFWEHLSDRPKGNPNQILGPDWGRERQAEALAAMVPWLESLGMDRNGNRVEVGA